MEALVDLIMGCRRTRKNKMENDLDEITPLDFLQAVYLNPNLPLTVRMKAAIEAAPYRHSKRSVTAIVDGNKSFAAALERAIERSKTPLPLPSPTPELPPEALKGPMPRLVRRF
jgi:hypothetical protein